jgi:hypothetical protein
MNFENLSYSYTTLEIINENNIELKNDFINLFNNLNLKTIYTIGDGSCLFHAFYNATNKDNYRNKSKTEKEQYVYNIRKDLSNLYEKIYNDYKDGTPVPEELKDFYDFSSLSMFDIRDFDKEIELNKIYKQINSKPNLINFIEILKLLYTKEYNFNDLSNENKEKINQLIEIMDKKIELNKKAIEDKWVYANQSIINLLKFYEKTNIILIDIDVIIYKITGFKGHYIDLFEYPESVIIKLDAKHYEPLVYLKEDNTLQGIFNNNDLIINNIIQIIKNNDTFYIKQTNNNTPNINSRKVNLQNNKTPNINSRKVNLQNNKTPNINSNNEKIFDEFIINNSDTDYVSAVKASLRDKKKKQPKIIRIRNPSKFNVKKNRVINSFSNNVNTSSSLIFIIMIISLLLIMFILVGSSM